MPDIGYWTRTNLDSLSPVTAQVVGLQTVTTASRTAGVYTYTGSWMPPGRDFNGNAVWETNTTVQGTWYDSSSTFGTRTRYILKGHDAASHPGQEFSTLNIIVEPTGSGSNGPISADAGLVISNIKKNWQGSTVDGEIDGIYIVGRQGARGDVGGLIIDVAAYGTSSANVVEAIEVGLTHMDSTGAIVAALNAQMATAKPGATTGGRWQGFESIALEGSKFDGTAETYGYLVTNAGTTTWLAAFASLGKSTYGLYLPSSTITFASIAIPNALPIKQANNTGALYDIININASNNLSIGDQTGGTNDVNIWPPLRIKNSLHLEVTNVTTNLALDATHCTLTVETGSLGVTVGLPIISAESAIGRVYHLTKIDSYGTALRVQINGGDMLNGTTFIDHTTQWEMVRVQAVASGHWVENIMNAG